METTAVTGRRSGSLQLGRAGEDAALDWYRSRGYVLVARNWRSPLGEVDLIVARGGLLVFCEVKTRLGAGFGGGYQAVTWKKQRKLRQLAELFLVTQAADPGRIRFDVASVYVRRRDRRTWS